MFLLLALSSSSLIFSHEEKSFLSWMRMTNQFFTGDEYHFRLGIFITNLRYIREFNAGKNSFKLGLNKLVCYTQSEYQSIIGSISIPQNNKQRPEQPQNSVFKKQDSIDWREKGLVNAIRDQGLCSAGYVFSMTQACESGYGLTHSFLPTFSDQNLLDCSKESEGCNGGTLDNVISQIVHYQQGYLMHSSDYPYVGYKREKCDFSYEKAVFVSIDFIVGNYGNEEKVAEFVSTGVCATMIDASQSSFQLYSSGIYNEPKCSSSRTTHGVGLVGYGTENGVDYWIVRNSWGTSWGEDGYIRMSRNKDNQCGIINEPTKIK